MIYFDNSATTLKKPPEVGQAVAFAIENFGNASRSFYPAAMNALREIYNTRQAVARLIELEEPLHVSFTSAATESLNLVIGGFVKPGDKVITTALEHNSVLRPLYLSGCDLKVLPCDDRGRLSRETFESLIEPDTKFFFCTHGSNVLGNVTEVYSFYEICMKHGIIMVLDISQTFGLLPVKADMADIFCFTGHKGLFGPQGTGGIVVSDRLAEKLKVVTGKEKFDGGENQNSDIKADSNTSHTDIFYTPVKTGGSGIHSFEPLHSRELPDLFEVGTMNSHGIYGLKKGVEFVLETGPEEIHSRETKLLTAFYNGIKDLPGITIYGEFEGETECESKCKAESRCAGEFRAEAETPLVNRLPVISINLEGFSSSDLAETLWSDYSIATRAGSHCAPLVHKHFGTEDRGMVRFSFSYFNTEEEIELGVAALKAIACIPLTS